MPSRLAISTMSLGACTAGHDLVQRLDLASQYGYEGIEIFYQDLVYMADPMDPAATLSGPACVSADRQLAAAHIIGRMCRDRGLTVICLQPFWQYEGLLDRCQHAQRLQELGLWIQLAHALQTDLLCIPSSFLPPDQLVGGSTPFGHSESLSGDVATAAAAADAILVADLRAAADLCAQADPPLRLSYEALAWGTRVDTWEQAWEAVRRVDRPNCGLCLDTFNLAARVFADPASPFGRTPDADTALAQSLHRLATEIDDPSRIFLVQVVDAQRLVSPLQPGHPLYVPGQTARQSWSRSCRLFYGESDRGAYLPIRAIAASIFGPRTTRSSCTSPMSSLGLGYNGWVSLELFNSAMHETGPGVAEDLARRGAQSWARLVRDTQIQVDGGAGRNCRPPARDVNPTSCDAITASL